MTQSTDTTSMQEQIEEILKEFEELTYKWTMALSPSQSYEELCRDFFRVKLNTIASKSAENERKSWYHPFDGLEIKLMYRDGDKVLQNKHVFSLEQINFIKGLSAVVQLKFSYMLKDLLASAPKQHTTEEVE